MAANAVPKEYQDIVVPVSQNYRGKSYSDWIVDWTTWLCSNEPDNERGPVLFLRARAMYSKTGNGDFTFERTGFSGPHIDNRTAIFFPVLASIVSEQLFPNLSTDALRYAAARYDTDNSSSDSLEVTISNEDIPDPSAKNRPYSYVLTKEEIMRQRAESSPFKLLVPQYYGVEPRMIEQVELSAGSYDAVCDGMWVLISGLEAKANPYKIHFKADGVRDYHIDAYYDIYVQDNAAMTKPTVSLKSPPPKP
jgi:hypothetical protein